MISCALVIMAKYLVYFIILFVEFKYISCANYQCQNETLNIDCPLGRVINITNSYYGTGNNTRCFNGNITEPKCSLVNATTIIGDTCNNNQHCTIFVNSTDLGDSCPGVSSFLQVNFTCISNKTCDINEHSEYGVCNCRGFCPNQKSCLPFCPLENVCVCNDGYLKDINTQKCVLAKYCPLKGNPDHNHEEFCECATRQKTCRNSFAFSFFDFWCGPGYACKDGYLREPYNNACVLPDECPRPFRRWR